MANAHAVIEFQDEDGGTVRINRGDEVSDSVPGYDALVEAGSVSDEPYDPSIEKPELPEEIVVDGVVYVKASDGAQTEGTGASE
jgi:hypothetical protein